MQLTTEHRQLSDTVLRFVREQLNPHVAEWEAAEQFPSHEVFKKLGDLGLLGLKYDPAYGGQGLDFSYSMVMAEALGAHRRDGCRAGRQGHGNRRSRQTGTRRSAGQ